MCVLPPHRPHVPTCINLKSLECAGKQREISDQENIRQIFVKDMSLTPFIIVWLLNSF